MRNLHMLSISNADELHAALKQISADTGTTENLEKGLFHILKLERAATALARFLFQELLMEGGHVVMKPRVMHGEETETDVLIMGTRYQLRRLIVRLRTQREDELQQLAEEMEKMLQGTNAE